MNGCVTVALAGEFQRGKTTLANALLGRNAAGRGYGLATTRTSRCFFLTPQIEIVDTPGFNANPQDSQMALATLEMADVFLYVHESKEMGEACENLFRMARDTGKSVLFLLNCMNPARWAPQENRDIAAAIEAELANKGFERNVLSFGKRQVMSVNVLWAFFGAGLLDSSLEEDQADMDAIRYYAAKKMKIPGLATMPEEVFRSEMLRRSGVPEVRDWLLDLPAWRLRDVLEQSERTFDRICAQFTAQLKKRWFAA